MPASHEGPITAVVLDLGNVVVGWDPSLPLADRMDRDQWQAFAQAVDFPTWNALADRGVPVREVVRRATAADPVRGPLLGEYFRRFGDSLTGPVPGMAAVIADLKTAGMRALGLTNWSAETYPHAPRSAPAIQDLDAVVVSGAEGLAKPDPELFRRMARRYDLAPGQTVFVDDTQRNVRVAADLGFRTVLFAGATGLRAELARLGVLGGPVSH